MRSTRRFVGRSRTGTPAPHDVDSDLIRRLGLIAHAPDDDAGVILLPLNHPLQRRHGLIENALTLHLIALSGLSVVIDRRPGALDPNRTLSA